MEPRLLLRAVDRTLPLWFFVYWGMAAGLWHDGALARASGDALELTALARWLCFGWVPASAGVLAVYAGLARSPLLASVSRRGHQLFVAGFVMLLPAWLALTEWGVHAIHPDATACVGRLHCSVSALERDPEVHVLGESPEAPTQRAAEPASRLASGPAKPAESSDAVAVARSAAPSERASAPASPSVAPDGRGEDAGAGAGVEPSTSSGPAGTATVIRAPISQGAGSGVPSGSAEPSSSAHADPASAFARRRELSDPREEPPTPGTAPRLAATNSSSPRPIRSQGDHAPDPAGAPQREGHWIEWAANGQKIFEGRYASGRRSGPCREWYEDGTPRLAASYRADVPQGDLVRWHPNGRLWVSRNELRTEDGTVLWVEDEFDDAGRRRAHQQYRDGLLQGPSRQWHANGQVSARGAYAAGRRHGAWIFWDESGSMRGHEQWERGERRHPPAARAEPARSD